jgi:hypothetical protein
MGAKGAFLGDTVLLIPPDRIIRARFNDILLPLGLFRVNDNDAIISLVHSAVLCRLDARGHIAMHAGDWQIGHINDGILPPLFAHDIDPPVTMARLRYGVPWPVIVHVLVLACKEAVVAVFALSHIDDQIPFCHWMPSSPFHFSI